MKKLLGLIVLTVMIVLPSRANAAQYKAYLDCPVESDGKTLVVKYSDDSKLTGVVTCTAKVDLTSGASLNSVTFNVYPGDMKVVSVNNVTGSGSWNASMNKTNNAYELVFNSSTSASGSIVELGKVIIDVKKAKIDDNCSFTYEPCVTTSTGKTCEDRVTVTEKNICKIVNGQYYGKNGNIVTEAVYTAECANNPQTGSFVPYMVIFAGVTLAAIVFVVSRRNTKLYKI